MNKIILLGANGQVGWELRRALAPLGPVVGFDRRQCDLAAPHTLPAVLARENPAVIVNAAAYTAVDKAESERDQARLINTAAVAVLAEYAQRSGALLVHYSTDYVFAGDRTVAYREDDIPGPLNVYGQTKLEGEQAIHDSGCRHLTFRTGWVFARRGNNFIRTILRLARERDELTVVNDQHGAPTSAELIADVTAHALKRIFDRRDADSIGGLYHLTAKGSTCWYDYAQQIIEQAARLGMPLRTRVERVRAIASRDYPQPATRPANALLNTEKLQAAFGLTLPDWRYHVARTLSELVAEAK